ERDGDDSRRAVGVAGEIGPACIHLDAEHPRASLILRADLAAGEPSARIDGGRDRRVGHAAECEGLIAEVLLRPGTAGMSAEVEPGPGKDDRRRRRAVIGLQIGARGRLQRRRHRDEAEARRDQLLHWNAPRTHATPGALGSTLADARVSTVASQGKRPWPRPGGGPSSLPGPSLPD